MPQILYPSQNLFKKELLFLITKEGVCDWVRIKDTRNAEDRMSDLQHYGNDIQNGLEGKTYNKSPDSTRSVFVTSHTV